MTGFELRPPERVNLTGTDEELGRGHLSNSSLNTLLACQQRYRWSYVERLEPAVKSTPLQLGSAFAHALEKGDARTGPVRIWEDARAQQDAAAQSPWVTAPDDEQTEIGAQIVLAAANAYLKQYGHSERREVEMRARIRNPAVGGRYSRTHDLVARVDGLDLESATLIEDKLTGSVQRGSLAQRLRLDRQVSIGAYLVWRCFGVEIREVRYRVTLKPAIRRKQNESHAEYLERIAQEYETRPEHYLVEEVVHRDRDDYLRLERELWRWAEQVREARHDGVWPRNTAACVDFGGCSYLSLCADEPGAAHQFVEKRERTEEAA